MRRDAAQATDLWTFEKDARRRGFSTICGVDEAGRGPLAGPVYAAAVILPFKADIEGLNDSKKLSERQRNVLYDRTRACAIAHAVAFADEREIDELNILNAAMLAMRRAVAALSVRPELALVDGNRDPGFPDVEAQTIVKGDARSASIAAASILAKVERDRFMLQMADLYPEYQFARHKGYPTALHYELLEKYGPCPIHRHSFRLEKRT